MSSASSAAALDKAFFWKTWRTGTFLGAAEVEAREVEDGVAIAGVVQARVV